MKIKRYLAAGVAVLVLVGAAAAGSNEEFTWRKANLPGPQHVDVITGHGKTCYVFTHQGPEVGGVLLWCEETK